jgi:hypothetical protein
MTPRTDSPDSPSGWYPDPSGSGQLRYWDGRAWSAHLQPAAPIQVSLKKTGKGPLLALSFGLFFLAFPALIIPPIAFFVWLTSVITLVVALTR